MEKQHIFHQKNIVFFSQKKIILYNFRKQSTIPEGLGGMIPGMYMNMGEYMYLS